jgi:hypothetical protein
MLSYILKQFEETEYGVISKIKEVETASGYIVNKHYYDVLIELYEWAMPLLNQTKKHWIYANDQVWKQLQAKDCWYYFTKRIGKQAPGYSDTSQCFNQREP